MDTFGVDYFLDNIEPYNNDYRENTYIVSYPVSFQIPNGCSKDRYPYDIRDLYLRKLRIMGLASLFSFLSSLEKVAEGNGEKSEERREKSEENKKKKPLTRLFLFGGEEGI